MSIIGTAALDLDDRIVDNSMPGALLYDADGNKVGGVAAILFATVTPGTGLTSDDFIIV